MNKNILYHLVKESFIPSVMLAVAFFIFQPFGSAYTTLKAYLCNVVLCEVSCCFMGCFLSLLICHSAFGYRFDTKDTMTIHVRKLTILYALCIPTTALLLCVVNHCFLPIEVNMTVSGYPMFLPTFFFYCIVVLKFCIVFFVVDVCLYHHRRTKHELEEMNSINDMLKSFQKEMNNICAEPNTCVLVGQNNNQILEIDPADIIYIESVANYAEVCYMNEEHIVKTTLRSTLKQMKEHIAHCDSIVQCHRGFLVNLNFVESLQCDKNSYYLQMFYIDKSIPVSRLKKADIKEALSSIV